MPTKVSIFICLLALFSCNQPKSLRNEKEPFQNAPRYPYFIDFEKNLDRIKSVSLSSIGEKIDYIPLETTTNSFLKNIIDIQFSDSSIFICDFDKLLQFDYNGRFIRQIGSNGRGPGEYIHIYGFCIDEIHNKIFIIGWGINKILEYNFIGDFCRSYNTPCFSQHFFLRDSSSYIFHLSNSVPGQPDYSDYSLYITDTVFVPKIKFRNYNSRKNKHSFSIAISPFYIYQNSIRFMEFCVDTLQILNFNELEPYAIFNLGKMKWNPDKTRLEPDIVALKNKIDGKLWISEILEDNNLLYIDINYGLDSSRVSLFNKKTNEITFLEENGFINDLDGGMNFWPRFVYHDSILVDYLKAIDLINYYRNSNSQKLGKIYKEKYFQVRKITNNVDQMSNPIIRVLKIK